MFSGQASSSAMSNPQAAWAPVEGFVRSSSRFRCSVSSYTMPTLSLTFLMQVVLSAILSRLYLVLGDFRMSTHGRNLVGDTGDVFPHFFRRGGT